MTIHADDGNSRAAEAASKGTGKGARKGAALRAVLVSISSSLEALAALPPPVKLTLLWPFALLCSAIFVSIPDSVPLSDRYQLFYPVIVGAVLLYDARVGALTTALALGVIHLTAMGRHAPPPGLAHVLTALDFVLDAMAYAALASLPRLLDRARAASAVTAQEKARQFQQFVEQAPVPMAIFDRDMCYLAASERWIKSQKIAPGHIGRTHYVDYPDFPEHWKEIHRRGLAGEAASQECELYIAADGQKRWVRWEVQPWRINRDEVGGILIFAEDITEYLLTQRALADNERRLAAVVDHAMDAIISADGDGRIVSANPAACELFGYRRDEMIGRTTQVLVPEPTVERDIDGAVARIEHVPPRSAAAILGKRRIVSGLRRSGESFPLELTVTEAPLANGPLRVGIMRDLSPIQAERRRVATLRDELAHLSRLTDMGAMVAGLAHEVGQPVAAILNFAAAYRRALAATGVPPAGDLVGKIEAQARRGAEILKRLRGFIDKKPPERRPVAVDALIDDALQLAPLRSAARIIRPDSAQAARELMLYVDPIQIEQILVNLLRNADDALRNAENPEIVISACAPSDDEVRLSIADNGEGVSRQAAPRLFEPFFTTKHHGMGVGLSISRGIAESHEGALHYRPNAPRGAIFDLDLPRARITPPAIADVAAESPPFAPEKAESLAKND